MWRPPWMTVSDAMFWRLVFAALACRVALSVAMPTMDHEGRVQMGVSSDTCDDGKTNLTLDWDPAGPGAEDAYTCDEIGGRNTLLEVDDEKEDCLPENMPIILHHVCMDTEITYTDNPPRSGSHRPLWPRYGEYLFCPKQRWVHSLEHGAAVFLYHPCAPEDEVKEFKAIARECLHRRIVTPYQELPEDKNFAIVTLRCRLLMGHVNKKAAREYLREHALKDAPEKTHKDGQYDAGLLQGSMPSEEGLPDPVVCPEPEASTGNDGSDLGIGAGPEHGHETLQQIETDILDIVFHISSDGYIIPELADGQARIVDLGTLDSFLNTDDEAS